VLDQAERAIVEELEGKYACSSETIALLLQQRRRLSSFSEKSRVLPHFLELMQDVAIIKKAEMHRRAVNKALDEERRRESRTVGEPQ
jgi:hypothetical protein